MKKNAAAMNTMTNTIAVVTVVSLRVGQVTRANSWRTCCTNSAALVLAMSDQIILIGHGRSQHHTRYYRPGHIVTRRRTGAGFPASRVDPPPVHSMAGVEGLEPPTPGFGD